MYIDIFYALYCVYWLHCHHLSSSTFFSRRVFSTVPATFLLLSFSQMVTKISEDTLQRGDPSCLEGVEDMVKMDILTVGSVLHNLRLALRHSFGPRCSLTSSAANLGSRVRVRHHLPPPLSCFGPFLSWHTSVFPVLFPPPPPPLHPYLPLQAQRPCDSLNTSRRFALAACNVCLVGENRTCSVPAL